MFVAGFMDSPRMNFLAAIVIEGQGFRLAVEGDAQMDVDFAHIHARTVPGTEVVLCIRPQHLALSDDGPLRLMPDVIEQLGDVGFVVEYRDVDSRMHRSGRARLEERLRQGAGA